MVCFDLCVVYGVGSCGDVCGVVCVVECVCFLSLDVACCVVMCCSGLLRSCVIGGVLLWVSAGCLCLVCTQLQL